MGNTNRLLGPLRRGYTGSIGASHASRKRSWYEIEEVSRCLRHRVFKARIGR